MNGVTTDFVTKELQVLAQKSGNDTLVWQIDANSNNIGFNYNGTQYFYIKNAQGDVVAITDASNNIVTEYVYDSWGKVASINDISGCNIGEINPIRYRGYYYDNETELYYLNARYYDPETGKFLNADDENVLFNDSNEILDCSLFTYCCNDPVNRVDPTGFASMAWYWWGYEIFLSKQEETKLLVALGALATLAALAALAALTASISTVFPDITISKAVAAMLWVTRKLRA